KIYLPLPTWKFEYIKVREIAYTGNDFTTSKYRVRKIAKPAEGVPIKYEVLTYPLYGNIYPSGCRLGEVATDLANLCESVSWDLGDAEREHKHPEHHVLVISDSDEICGTFSTQYNTLLISDDELDLDTGWIDAKYRSEASAHDVG